MTHVLRRLDHGYAHRRGARPCCAFALGLAAAAAVGACAARGPELRVSEPIGRLEWGPDRARAVLEAAGFEVMNPVSSDYEIRVVAERRPPVLESASVRDVVHVTLRRQARHGNGIEIRAWRYEADEGGKWRAVDPEPLRGLVDTLARLLPRRPEDWRP